MRIRQTFMKPERFLFAGLLNDSGHSGLPSAGRLVPSLCLAAAVSMSCGAVPSPELPPDAVKAETGAAPAADSSFAGSSAALPASLRVAYLAARQSEGRAEHAFRPVHGTVAAVQAQNSRQGLAVRLDAQGLHLRSARDPQAPEISMRLARQGCADAPREAAPAAPQTLSEQHGVEYSRPGVTEWYVNGPLGLEHGFTVKDNLGCGDGKLAFELTLDGEVEAALVDRSSAARIVVTDRKQPESGRVLVYSDLFAVDAAGRELPSRLMLSERTVRLEVEAAGARYPVTVDPLWTEETKLISSDGARFDLFGGAVAVSGDTAIIGASQRQVAGNDQQGAAYVFVRSGTSWVEQATLVGSDGAANDHFGGSVAVSGDTAVIGAPYKDIAASKFQGAAYVFVRSGASWSEQARLIGADGVMDDGFGWSVAVSGNTAVIGARNKQVGMNVFAGQAYVFVRSGTSWSEQAKLVRSDGSHDEYFGTSVAVSGNTALVSAPFKQVGAKADQGQVYVYVRSGSAWSEQAKLVSSDGAAGDAFGYSLALDGNTAVIGAFRKQVGINLVQGEAYIFVRSGAAWTEQARLIAPDGEELDYFGLSVAISGDTAVIGAPYKVVRMHTDQGQAYVYVRSGTSWTQEAKLSGSDGASGDEYGSAVAVSGDNVIIGAPTKTVYRVFDEQGQAYAVHRGLAANGMPCAKGSDCASSFCVDGLCCDTACGGGVSSDCQSCIGARTGGSNGTCGIVTAASGYTCRTAAASCDKPEVCDGISRSCPADALYLASDRHLCQPATSCSPASYCDGSSSGCPASVCLPSEF